MNRILNTRVSGVTFEGRQALIAQIDLSDPCRLEPEPDNAYDKNAIAVKVAHNGAVWHIGYIPKEIAAQIAPYLDGEALMCKLAEITGGFELNGGETAAFGVRLQIELPSAAIEAKGSVPYDRYQGEWE